ncbi:MAG: RNA polymerase sigma-70 factor [Bacteroidota bacterium]|jgi:RNA polymerase sigma-70 factor (ECF subfamily)|nr:RNA polymerase sigma-70 factor [Bacteroidota bacterium]
MVQFGDKGMFAEKRNPELFDDLFRQYSKPLFYYAAKFVDDEAARDIVQDVFVKLWSDQSITIKQSLNALLFTMVRNSCLQLIEKQKVRSKYFESAKLKLQEEELRFYMEEKTSLMEQELEDKLNEVLNNLPDRCRQIFTLSRFENKKNKEIAGELDISVKAVEKQITKALGTIRTEMKDYLPLLMFLSGHLFKD